VTRLDTHNQPAVIEAFKAWARTLTRAYAQFAVGFSRFSRAWLHLATARTVITRYERPERKRLSLIVGAASSGRIHATVTFIGKIRECRLKLSRGH